MKLSKTIKTLACTLLLSATVFTSCDYLDVVPPEQAGLPDATKDNDATLRFLYSCYAGVINPFNYSGVEAASDEWVLPELWNETMHRMLYNLNTPASLQDGWRWGNNTYRFIGQCFLFQDQLENAKGVTDEQKKEWRAESEFLIAYYHMMTLMLYGPCPITDSYIPMDANESTYNGRSHFDYVVDWVVEKFDEAAKDLPATRHQDQWGRATSTIAKALKARLLLHAASPLWNGNFPYPEWKNTKFETPGYGYDLVSTTYSRAKWERAQQAVQEAITLATNAGGNSLYTDEAMYERENVPLPFVPGVNANTAEGQAFLKKVMLMRYLVTTRTTEGNKEIIWGHAGQGNMEIGSQPHFILRHNNGNIIGGYSGVSPLLSTTIEYFYTKNGKRPAHDRQFTANADWFKSAGINGRADIINLNVGREPRFYAWMAFDGGDYGNRINNGNPLRMEARNANTQGYNPSVFNRDNNVTGYFSQKYIKPNYSRTPAGAQNNNQSKPRPLIRLAELYLTAAECAAELGQTDEALRNLNIIRTRAGVPELTTADITAEMPLRDWVRNERFIELWGEGHRYYDVRRWMIAPQTMAQGVRTGLNALIVNPSFEVFNTPTVVNQPFVWDNRMYLLPLFLNEVYKNPQMVQAPGYN